MALVQLVLVGVVVAMAVTPTEAARPDRTPAAFG